MNTIILLIVIIALAIIWAGLGEFCGDEPISGASLVTYPIKMTFKKRWFMWVYRIGWVALSAALCFDVTQLYLQHSDNWGWLLIICPLAVLALIIAAMVFAIVMFIFCVMMTGLLKDLDLK